MEFVLNAGLGVGALLFLLMLFKAGKKLQDYFFLFWILATVLQIGFYQITIFHFDIIGIWAILGFALPLLGAPLLFLYICTLTGNKPSISALSAHIGFFFIYCLVFYMALGGNLHSIFASQGFLDMYTKAPFWMDFYAIPMAVSGLLYCIWDLLLLRRHKKRISQLYSYQEQIDLGWLNYVVYSYFVLFLVTSFLVFGGIHLPGLALENSFALTGICLSLMLILFGFQGLRQPHIFTGIPNYFDKNRSVEGQDDKISYAKSGLSNTKIATLGQQLKAHMEGEKPYLDDNLDLSSLAGQCGCSQVQLSQVINQYFGKSFYDFINEYRVEEAKKRLYSKSYDHLSVLGIAFECGFKSKSTFNRYFKRYTGSSPSQFKKNRPQ